MSMREAQERLNGLGYNVGTPDGAAGPKTAGRCAVSSDPGPAGDEQAGHGHGRRCRD